MSDITIKIIAGFNGETSEIIANANSTIKELKEKYATQDIIYKGEIQDAREIKKAASKYAYNFKFVLGTRILYDNTTLNEVLEGDVLKGEVTINAIKRPRLCADCLRDINELASIYNSSKQLVKIEAILGKEINEEEKDVEKELKRLGYIT